MSLTEKQKASREGKVGSSDAAVIAEVSPYKTVFELFCQLVGTLPRYTEDETRFQRIGSLIELPIARLVAKEQGLKIRRSPPRVHPLHPFMSANLDFEIVNHPKGVGCFEIKNRGAAKPYDELPDDITIQVAHQLAVTQREWALVAVLFGYGTLKTYEVQRDKELEGYLIELEAKFMERVQKNEPPDHTWTPQTVDLLKRLYPKDSGQVITLPDELAVECASYVKVKEILKEWEDRKALFEGRLKSALGEASSGKHYYWNVSWKSTKDSTTFNEKQFAQDHPDLYAKYETTRPGYRRFAVTPTKEGKLWISTQPSETTSQLKPDSPEILPSPTTNEPSSSPS